MIDEETAENIRTGGKLIAYGLDKSFKYRNNPEFVKVINEYSRNGDVRTCTDIMADSLMLKIIEVGREGVFLATKEGSIFQKTKAQLSKLIPKKDSKYISLILIAISAFYYPYDHNFSEPRDFPLTITILERYIDDSVQKILFENPSRSNSTIHSLAKAYEVLPGRSQQDDNKQSTRQYMIHKTLKYLTSEGFFSEQDNHYYPTKQYELALDNMIEEETLLEYINSTKGVK